MKNGEKMNKYKVVRFQLGVNTPNSSEEVKSIYKEGAVYRDYVTLGTDLDWDSAKDLNRANHGSWIVKQ